jgi:L-ribulose-5-phosphate 3-epimerase
MSTLITRRELMAGAAAAFGCSGLLKGIASAAPKKGKKTQDAKKPRFQISSPDWSLGARGELTAFDIAKKIGLDGVEVSFGDPKLANDLRKKDVQKQFADAANAKGLEISSLAMSILSRVPLGSDPESEKIVEDCIDVMTAMGQKRVLMAFFGKGNLKDQPEKIKETIRRLKKVAPKAEKAGVQLAIESTLNADEHMHIIDSVASPAVTVYYDVANMHYRGYDIYKEIRQLGKHISQFHMKERNCLLGDGEIDFRKVKEAIDAIDFRGWLAIEGAKPKTADLVESYTANQKFLRSIFCDT